MRLPVERLRRWASWLVLIGATVAWLWPIGTGGQMPVGGDVTRFSIGLMSELRTAYREFRLPLWNPRWGFGFPGLAESQMGVYYPPHVLLYGGLWNTEAAYTASMFLHTLFAAIGARWASRRFGASEWAAALSGLAYALCGWFLIHQTHQWGYTVASWMPWAWGLAWPLSRGEGSGRDALKLAAVLTVQVLPGHFQMAFITQVGVLALGVWGLVERPSGSRRGLIGFARIVGAILAVFCLGAMQLVPTYELAKLAESDRDFEYLSGFASSPFHLISYVSPGLFHRSPLWRPVAWDPFHSSPEEHLATVGLVPLFLAIGAIRRGWRTDPATRALGWLALGSLLLCLGPYAPGFRSLIELPGFSFFRAPARWGLATQLALALLAARGFDRIRTETWTRVGRGLVGFVVLVIVWSALTVGFFELALRSTGSGEMKSTAMAIEQARERLSPWPGDPKLPQIIARARQAPSEGLVISQLIGQGIDPARARLDRDRRAIYTRELGPTAVLVSCLLILALVGSRWPRSLVPGLLILALADLLALGWLDRPIQTAPIRPLTQQSPLLQSLAELGSDARVLSDLGNLPLAARVGSLPAYRTLDRPALDGLISSALTIPYQLTTGNPGNGPLGLVVSSHDGPIRSALRWLGINARVFGPFNLMSPLPGRSDRLSEWEDGFMIDIVDPLLLAWDHGPKFVDYFAIGGNAGYRIWRPRERPSVAWWVPVSNPSSLATPPTLASSPLDAWKPLRSRSPVAGRFEVDVNSDGPGWVILSVLDDPEWSAVWVDGRGTSPATQQQAFRESGRAGWLCVPVAGTTSAVLRWTYQGRSAYRGLGVSAVAWAVWGLSYWRAGRRSDRRSDESAKGEAA